MGKAEDDQSLPNTAIDARVRNPNAGNRHGCCLSCNSIPKLVSFRCVLFLVLGVGVLLSAVFWLPIFHFGDPKDLDLDYRGHDIVASFMLRQPASFLQDNTLQLEDAIFDEMRLSSTKIEIISLEPHGPNTTKVVFAVECDVTFKILISDALVTLFLHQSPVNWNLFGEPFSFEVLKFRGGLIVSPSQKGFLFQDDQIHFNFTLNFCIEEILNNFDELNSQLKAGLNLAPYENLYVRLINLKGSTVAPPTTVQSRVLLAVGIPTRSRLKELAKTIGSHSKNLGLNNTVFGRVKQVRLSSFLQHSLGGDASGPSPSPSPSLSPLPHPNHHHHHHHHHYHRGPSIAPNISPSPSEGNHRSRGKRGGSKAPAPVPAPYPRTNKRAPRPACHSGNNNRFPWKHHMYPPHMAPSAPPVHGPAAAPPRPLHAHSPKHKLSPVPATSPHSAAFAHSHPSTTGGNGIHSRPLESTHIGSPAPSPSSAGTFSFNIWVLLPLLLITMLS